MFEIYATTTVRFLFLFAPFFVVSMFLALTRAEPKALKRSVAVRATLAAALIGTILFFAGPTIFSLIGITLDSFRIGAGSLLFLTAVSLVNHGTRNHAKGLPDEERDDVAVVPLAMPVIFGPATIGTVVVMGADLETTMASVVGLSGMLSALLIMSAMLLVSGYLEDLLGRTGLNILSKVSGLILAAMAAEIVFTGIKNFLA